MAHADTLDQPERMAPSFWISVAMHAVILGSLILYGVAGATHVRWGDKEGGGFGAVTVNIAPIPLPGRTGPVNPVANNTESQVPAPPPKPKSVPKAVPKVKAPEPDAIALKSKSKSKATQEPASTPNKFREQQKDAPNQLYNSGGQALSSPMIGRQGSGGLSFGTSTPFGDQLGWYANQLQDKVAQHWKKDDLTQIRSAPHVVVRFTIRRDGSVVGVPEITQSSGIPQLDRSAQRAVVDSGPFPPIPPQFPRNEAEIELTFELVH